MSEKLIGLSNRWIKLIIPFLRNTHKLMGSKFHERSDTIQWIFSKIKSNHFFPLFSVLTIKENCREEWPTWKAKKLITDNGTQTDDVSNYFQIFKLLISFDVPLRLFIQLPERSTQTGFLR